MDLETFKTVASRVYDSNGMYGVFRCKRCVIWKQAFAIDLQYFLDTLKPICA